MAKARMVLRLVLMKQLQNRVCMMWQGRLGLAARARAPLPHRVLRLVIMIAHKSQIAIAGGLALCLGKSVANVEVLPVPMLPVGNWGVGLVQSSEWLGQNWNWIVDSDNVFCPLSLNSFAFAAGSFGVSESLRRFEDFF